MKLEGRFPRARIIGVFIARRVLPKGEALEAMFDALV
jgi:hypothetical protein